MFTNEFLMYLHLVLFSMNCAMHLERFGHRSEHLSPSLSMVLLSVWLRCNWDLILLLELIVFGSKV